MQSDRAERKCRGNGRCFTSVDGETYTRAWCRRSCKLEQCPNFLVCNGMHPRFKLDLHGGVCEQCEMQFSTCVGANATVRQNAVLQFVALIECAVCCETAVGVTLPACSHVLCCACFRRLWFPTAREAGVESMAPPFPYDIDTERAYLNDRRTFDFARWPLVELWEQWVEYHVHETFDRFIEAEQAARCPFCRAY